MATRRALPITAAFAAGCLVGAFVQRRLRPCLNQQVETEIYDAPENAPEHCPGVKSQDAGKAAACEGCPNRSICASGQAGGDSGASQVRDKLANVKHKVLVLSGKGGVGKSTVATQLAWVLQDAGFRVGLMDIDVCGPSVPRMTGTEGETVSMTSDGWQPVYVTSNLCIISIGFLLPEPDDAVIWRGPKKNGLIKQFLTDVIWGDLDYLLIDTPPGTSDEHMSMVTYLEQAGIDGALIVTSPQEISLQDVRKEISFCKKTNVNVLGVIENFKGSMFDAGVGDTKGTCERMGVPYAGAMPMEAAVLLACEKGQPLSDVNPDSKALAFLKCLVQRHLPQ